MTNEVDLLYDHPKVPVDLPVDYFVTYVVAKNEKHVLGPHNSMVIHLKWSIWRYYTAVKPNATHPPPWKTRMSQMLMDTFST